jgi:4-methylaminobutanoate oxidase (formaldehyde-forming)
MGMGFVENNDGATVDFINSGKYKIDIAGTLYPAQASLKPMYDPEGKKVRS